MSAAQHSMGEPCGNRLHLCRAIGSKVNCASWGCWAPYGCEITDLACLFELDIRGPRQGPDLDHSSPFFVLDSSRWANPHCTTPHKKAR